MHDTVMMREAVTVQLDAAGDTIYRSVVTDRERVRDRTALAEVREKTELQVDTVFVAVRDSTDVRSSVVMGSRGRASPVILALKWVFWILVALAVCSWGWFRPAH